MSQYGSNVPASPGNGSTCDVTAGAGTIQLNNIDATAYVNVGDLIAVGDDVVSYEIDGVTFGGTHTSVSIVGTYGGSTQTGASYVVNTGFTTNRGYALPDQGDVRGLLAVRAGFVEIDKDVAALRQSGTTANRPTTDLYVGRPYFDTTLGHPIWYNGTGWVDATGTSV